MTRVLPSQVWHLDICSLHGTTLGDGVAESIGQCDKKAHFAAELDSRQTRAGQLACACRHLPRGHLGPEWAAWYGLAPRQHDHFMRACG